MSAIKRNVTIGNITLIQGDCLEVMPELIKEGVKVHSVVCDPPYELGFMGKSWDSTGIAYNKNTWQLCNDILIAGGYLTAFAGSRTYHRIACAIEDGGFDVRNLIAWIYGSGFPKSLDISKALDKRAGKEREVVGKSEYFDKYNTVNYIKDNKVEVSGRKTKEEVGYITAPATPEAKQWEGWGSQLKPALEPCCLAQKPCSEKTIAENVLKNGVGGMNIDGTRIGETGARTNCKKAAPDGYAKNRVGGKYKPIETKDHNKGRYPSNLLLEDCEEVEAEFAKYGESKGRERDGKKHTCKKGTIGGDYKFFSVSGHNDKGTPSRYFKKCKYEEQDNPSFYYSGKVSQAERNEGLDSYITVKYSCTTFKKWELLQWLEENMVLGTLLKKVISEWEVGSSSIGECGESIMVQFRKDILSTIKTEISKTTELKILNLLMPLLTNECIQVVNCEKEYGGKNALSVKNGSLSMKNIGILLKKNGFPIIDVASVIYELLSLIKENGDWKEKTNIHSTVKPIALLAYLQRLITPPNGIILDPFMGSGSGAISAYNEGFQYIGIEIDPEYFNIAVERVKAATKQQRLF